jgi:hypothetical protein
MDTLGHRVASVTSLVALLIGSLLAGAAWSSSSDRTLADPRTPASEVLVLTGDADARAHQLAAMVVDAARRHGLPVRRLELEIRSVDRVEHDTLLGGRTDGRLIHVGRNVALPDRTLLHEMAHAVVGLEDGHGQLWRRVYLTAIEDAFDLRMVASERRRIEWVYDRSYLDGS